MAHCTSCGSQLIEGAHFCGDCGKAQGAAADNRGAFAKGQTAAMTEAFEKKNPIHKKWWFWVIAVLLLGGIASAVNDRRDSETDIPDTTVKELIMPAASDELEGKNYQDVLTKLKNAGFSDIETEPLEDLVFAVLHDEGEVEEVSVDGETVFDAGARYPDDAPPKIIVRYHSYPKQFDQETLF